MRASLIALALAAACSPAAAMEHPATAGTLMRVFAAARDGDVIRLQGDFPLVVLQGRTFARPVTIDAGKAKLTSIVVKNVTGLEWDGGRFQPADRPAFSLDGAQGVTLRQLDVVGDGHQNGVIIRDSRDVTLADSRFDRPRVAISLVNVQRAHIQKNDIVGWSADGIGLSSVSDSTVEENACTDPVRVDDDVHIDCIQGYFTGVPGNHDILVKGNRIHGRGTQGIFFNSYAKFPPPKAITIVDNTVETADAPNGVLLEDDPEGVVRGNHVSTLPGSKWQTRVAVLHAKTRHCGNKIDGYLRWRAEEEDRCPKS